MTKSHLLIRQMRPDDDFEKLRNLLSATKQSYYNDPRLNVVSAENLKQTYTEKGSGFIAQQDGRIVGFIGVVRPNPSQNGLLEYAVADDDSPVLEQLLVACTEVIKNSGGQKLYYFANTAFGQIRNKQITLLEKMGFVSDQYSIVNTAFSLTDWTSPEMFDATGIVPDTMMKTKDIYELLLEDGEQQQAELFRNQYPERLPNVVILTLVDADHLLVGFAYFKVQPNDHPTISELNAVAFGLHFRPGLNVSKEDQRRLLQAALLAMKQLNVAQVVTNFTLKNFDTLAVMIKEGFDDFLANSLRLVKRI